MYYLMTSTIRVAKCSFQAMTGTTLAVIIAGAIVHTFQQILVFLEFSLDFIISIDSCGSFECFCI